jgi:citrate lyase subunit gamma (acyl carrier protein)
MKLKIAASAGTLESSDVQITLRPNPGQGIQIDLESDVKATFGDAIEATVRRMLSEFDIKDALVAVNDKGALDFVIRSRMQCAICRASGTRFDWGKEDLNG